MLGVCYSTSRCTCMAILFDKNCKKGYFEFGLKKIFKENPVFWEHVFCIISWSFLKSNKIKAAFEIMVNDNSKQRYAPFFQCNEGTWIWTRVEPLFPIAMWNHFLSGTAKNAIRTTSQTEDFKMKNNGNLWPSIHNIFNLIKALLNESRDHRAQVWPMIAHWKKP